MPQWLMSFEDNGALMVGLKYKSNLLLVWARHICLEDANVMEIGVIEQF